MLIMEISSPGPRRAVPCEGGGLGAARTAAPGSRPPAVTPGPSWPSACGSRWSVQGTPAVESRTIKCVASSTRCESRTSPRACLRSDRSAVLADPGLYNALGLTFLIMIASWLVQTPISLLLGVFTAGSQRYRAALAVLYFLPLLLSSAAVAIAFKALLDPNFGLATGLGLPFLAQDWLGVPHLALGLVIFVIAWQFVPFHTLIYQGGVRQIPKSLYEAAEIDGAGTIKQFFHITLPQLKYTIITSSTLMVVGSLTYFDLIFVLTGGGPGNSYRFPGHFRPRQAGDRFPDEPAEPPCRPRRLDLARHHHHPGLLRGHHQPEDPGRLLRPESAGAPEFSCAGKLPAGSCGRLCEVLHEQHNRHPRCCHPDRAGCLYGPGEGRGGPP
ncbi:membrane hypothetical protein [Arthrobacter sp. 9AX]|nr:membrane hypothetical protein [Arthrobacter sp. 9AX]